MYDPVMHVRGMLAAVILASITSPTTEPAAEPEPQATGNWRVSWENVKATEGCFFFSGPSGRDDRLVGEARIVRDGQLVAIHIAKVTFRGSLTDLGFVVTRQSRHEYDGPWDVSERISGTSFDSPIRARYRYSECEVGKACPGECTIDATIVFKR
jgi:hypothetical protein